MTTATAPNAFKMIRGVLRYTASDGSKWVAIMDKANGHLGYCTAKCGAKGYEHMHPSAISLEAMVGGIETSIYL